MEKSCPLSPVPFYGISLTLHLILNNGYETETNFTVNVHFQHGFVHACAIAGWRSEKNYGVSPG